MRKKRRPLWQRAKAQKRKKAKRPRRRLRSQISSQTVASITILPQKKWLVPDPENTEEEPSTIDLKERLKKVTTMKKKKLPSKDMDEAAKAAAVEAASRKAKLAAAKKEKRHYNQQPAR